MTILLSTTQGWNPGDDFIRWGVKRLLSKKYGPGVNWIFHNRNPDRLQLGENSADNSWKCGSLVGVDLVVFAGTPEWCGPAVAPLTRAIVEQGTQAIYFGIGVGGPAGLNENDHQVLHRSRIICRDPAAYEMFKDRGAILLPCPSLFAAIPVSQGSAQSSLGIVWQLGGGLDGGRERARWAQICHSIDANLSERIFSQAQERKMTIICHYVEDFRLLLDFGDRDRVLYSAESSDYVGIYALFRAIASTRLHGCMLAAAMEKPAYLLRHDSRSTGAIGLVPWIKAVTNLDECRSELSDAQRTSMQQFKRDTWDRYMEALP